MAEIKIQKAIIENLKEILELNQKLCDYDYKNFDDTIDCTWPSNNKRYFKESIESEDSLTLVVLDEEKIIGYLIGSIGNAEDYRKINKIAEIDNMFVLSEYQNKGIGKSLIKRFFEWAKEKGIKRVKVVASAENTKAINFYEKNKFLNYNIILEKDIK